MCENNSSAYHKVIIAITGPPLNFESDIQEDLYANISAPLLVTFVAIAQSTNILNMVCC